MDITPEAAIENVRYFRNPSPGSPITHVGIDFTGERFVLCGNIVAQMKVMEIITPHTLGAVDIVDGGRFGQGLAVPEQMLSNRALQDLMLDSLLVHAYIDLDFKEALENKMVTTRLLNKAFSDTLKNTPSL